MPLPHFTQLQMTGSPGGPGSNPQEPLYLNLFEITFILPTILQAQGRDPVLLLQQAKSIDLGLTNKAINVAAQRFKYSERMYTHAGPPTTHALPVIAFNVNQNSVGTMESWQTLKAWYDLVWNSQNGFLHYKADTIGTIIVNYHDKKGFVLRRVTFQNCQITSLGSPNLAWTGTDIWADTTANFVADYWIDETIDQNFTITPPFVAGY
jgi:hypothetical protein